MFQWPWIGLRNKQEQRRAVKYQVTVRMPDDKLTPDLLYQESPDSSIIRNHDLHSMTDKSDTMWLACPYCHLSFAGANEYELHSKKEHDGRKRKMPTKIPQRGV